MSQSAIYQWISKGFIKAEAVDAALVVADEQPDAAQWPVFIRSLLLQLGLLSLLLALLFFTAFNWQAMGHLFKFALVQAVLVILVAAYVLMQLGVFSRRFHIGDNSYKVIEDVLLVMLFFTIGGLLALLGQVYQTGADPWQLFAFWSLFVSLLVVVSGRAVLWILWSLLVNLALILYLERSIVFLNESNFIGLFLMLNGSLLLVLEVISEPAAKIVSNKRFGFLVVSRPWAYQLQALAVLICASFQSFVAIFEWQNYAFYHGLSALVVMALVFAYYRFKRFDLPVLALWMMAAMTIVMALLIKILDGLDENMLLLLAIVLIAMTAAAVKWLKVLHKEAQDHE